MADLVKPRGPRVVSRLQSLLLVLACLQAEACILYTDPVNSPPTVQIQPPAGPINRGQEVKIYALVTDPDGDTVTLAWSTSMGDCQPPFDASLRPPATFTGSAAEPFVYTFAPSDPMAVCVWVVATDSHGASTTPLPLDLMSSNRPPVPVITVLEPTTNPSTGLFDLYSTFRLSAAMSHDPDGDMIQEPLFKVTPPPNAPRVVLDDCPNATVSDFVKCFSVGANPGLYKVNLSVSDGIVTVNAPETDLFIAQDHPACLKSTDPSTTASPLVLDPGTAKTFTVTEILDDGAPLPTPPSGAAARPTFAWTISRNGGSPAPVAGYDNVNALTLPGGSYATGDVVDVAVTISDGVAMHLDPMCDPRCPAGCPSAAHWTVAYR